MFRHATALTIAAIATAPACAASARDALVKAAFATGDKASALAQIDAVAHDTDLVLQKAPTNREAQMVHAMAVGYQAKLNRSRSSAMTAKTMFETLAARDPHDPEAQAAVGGWHVDAIAGLGGFMARTILGANKATGFAALDRAVALGGNRAMFPGLAALLRLQLDASDPRGIALAEAATRGTTPTQLDLLMQRSAVLVLKQVRSGGDAASVRALAKRLLPLGRLS